MNYGKTRFGADPTHCAKCGSGAWSEITYSDTVDVRGLHVNVEGLRLNECTQCKRQWVSSEQRRHNDEVIKAAFVKTRDETRWREGLLSGGEIQQVRERFGLSQRDASCIFGGGVNSFNKYESGEVLQSQAMDNLLRITFRTGDAAVDFLRTCKGMPLAAAVAVNIDDVIAQSPYKLGSSIKVASLANAANRESEFASLESFPESRHVVPEELIYMKSFKGNLNG